MYDMMGCVCYAWVDPDEPVLVAGDPEQFNEKLVRRVDALVGHLWSEYIPSLLIPPHYNFFFRDSLTFQNNLAGRLGVAHMSVQ